MQQGGELTDTPVHTDAEGAVGVMSRLGSGTRLAWWDFCCHHLLARRVSKSVNPWKPQIPLLSASVIQIPMMEWLRGLNEILRPSFSTMSGAQ